jgi:O-methyltransferase involved in polyketide biosynthesis
MARTDQDTWDLASSVGATATWVAAARALASQQHAFQSLPESKKSQSFRHNSLEMYPW